MSVEQETSFSPLDMLRGVIIKHVEKHKIFIRWWKFIICNIWLHVKYSKPMKFSLCGQLSTITTKYLDLNVLYVNQELVYNARYQWER